MVILTMTSGERCRGGGANACHCHIIAQCASDGGGGPVVDQVVVVVLVRKVVLVITSSPIRVWESL